MARGRGTCVAALVPGYCHEFRYYHDYSYAAIGEALGITEGAAGALLSRALDRLRGELDGSAGTIRP